MTQIVCLSRCRWQQKPGKLQNILQRLPHTQVLFFEPYQPWMSRQRRPREGVRISEWVTVYSLPAEIPQEIELMSGAIVPSRKNAAFIQKRMQEHGIERPTLWLSAPEQYAIPELVPNRGFLYDCDEDWSDLPELWEDTLCDNASVVFVASKRQYDRLYPISHNMAMLYSGLDLLLFAPAEERGQMFPADLQGIGAPVFGYLGDTDDFTELQPVLYTASRHPEWSFVFVGDDSRWNESWGALQRLDNVYFLGEKSVKSQPRYLSYFDVCFTLLDPHCTDPGQPTEQLFQYFITGKPVVCMCAGAQPSEFAGIVLDAHFEIDFMDACARALEEPDSMAADERRRIASEGDWQSRADMVMGILEANGLA